VGAQRSFFSQRNTWHSAGCVRVGRPAARRSSARTTSNSRRALASRSTAEHQTLEGLSSARIPLGGAPMTLPPLFGAAGATRRSPRARRFCTARSLLDGVVAEIDVRPIGHDEERPRLDVEVPRAVVVD